MHPTEDEDEEKAAKEPKMRPVQFTETDYMQRVETHSPENCKSVTCIGPSFTFGLDKSARRKSARQFRGLVLRVLNFQYEFGSLSVEE